MKNSAMTEGAAVAEAAEERNGTLHSHLRQMIAVLEAERQALATLEADELFEVTHRKEALCENLADFGPDALDSHTRDLVNTAKALNEVNRRVRNLLAANVATRLEVLGSPRHSYKPTDAAIA